MTWVIGTASVRIQIDPGISFHPGCVISHIQYPCTVNMIHIKTNNTAAPERKGLVRHRKGVKDRILVHRSIFLCSRQGVIRTTVNTIEILAPLLNNEFDDRGRASKGPHQTGV